MSDALFASQIDALNRLTRYVQAQPKTVTRVEDVLDRLEEYLDDRVDVDDGIPNEEAKLLAELRWVRR